MVKSKFNTYSVVTGNKRKVSAINPKVIVVMISILFVIIALWLTSESKKKGNTRGLQPSSPFPPVGPSKDFNTRNTPLIPGNNVTRVTRIIK